MKRTVFIIIVTAAFGVLSCNNENTINPRPSDEVLGTATITGKLQAELNDTQAGLENVPDGIKVFAVISTKDLVLNPSNASYPNQQFETTTTGGVFTFSSIPVGPNGINVTLHFSSFRADRVNGGTTTSTVFPAPSDMTVSGLRPNEVRVIADKQY